MTLKGNAVISAICSLKFKIEVLKNLTLIYFDRNFLEIKTKFKWYLYIRRLIQKFNRVWGLEQTLKTMFVEYL